MVMKLTDETTRVELSEGKALDGIPLYQYQGNERVKFSDLIKAEERWIAEKNNISIFNIFELALLYADVKQKRNAIREKYRFNKMLFYIWKKLEEEFGEDVFIFDKMVAARAGPIPASLTEDIKNLEARKLLEIYLVKDGKILPGSRKNWQAIKGKAKAGIECNLTKEGLNVARNVWRDLDPELHEIILAVKKEINYMDRNKIKTKVHKDYPMYKKNYIKEDKDSFEKFLLY